VTLGATDRIPGISEILEVLKKCRHFHQHQHARRSSGRPPQLFVALLPRLQELRARTGRPHWIVIDEAHHLLPAELDSATLTIPSSLGSFAMITVHPKSVSRALLEAVNCVIAIGPNPQAIIEEVNVGSGKGWAPPQQPTPGQSVLSFDPARSSFGGLPSPILR